MIEEDYLFALEKIRWPNGFKCVRCGSSKVRRIKALGKTGKQRKLFWCQGCEYQYSATVGTVFHDSHLSLAVWFAAVHAMRRASERPTAKSLQLEFGISYAAAWNLRNKVSYLMQDDSDLCDKIVLACELAKPVYGRGGIDVRL